MDKDNSNRLDKKEVEKVSETIGSMRKEISKAFIGQDKVVDSLIRALLCDGHTLLEGVPGIAKTLAIKSLAQVSGCTSKRIQFTVDLLPSDIIGLTSYTPGKGFDVVKGPIFANFIVADEINRSPPKTQSALIEAMQEKRVTIGKQTFELPSPFFVMANQNPIENEGVYSLPEAQIDRFLFKILIGYPEKEDESKIMEDNVTFKRFEDLNIKPVTSAGEIIKMQKMTHRIYLDNKVKEYILELVNKTRNKNFNHGEYITLGCSPRASIALFIAAKAEALIKGRNYVIPNDVKSVAHDVLRHRIMLSYKAKAENINVDKVVDELLKSVVAP